MPWNPLKPKVTVTAKEAKYSESAKVLQDYLNVEFQKVISSKPEPNPQLPGIHCPACGGALLHKINQAAYGCPCELVKINSIELINGNLNDKGSNFHKALLKAKLEMAAAYAVDMAFAKQNPWQVLEKPKVKWSGDDPLPDLQALPAGHPYLEGYPPPATKQEPLKADRSTIKLENLSPALQEFFKDYLKPDKVES